MTGNHNGPIGLIKKEVVRVVFRTVDGENYYKLDEEVRKEYDNGETVYITDHNALKKKYEDKLKNGETISDAQNLNNISDKRDLADEDVVSIFVTNYSNK